MITLLQKIKPRQIIALVGIAVTWINFNQERWLDRIVITFDVAQYYSYLPTFFYEHDLSQAFLNDTVNSSIEKKIYAPNVSPNGKYVFKMTMGMALTYLPFFGMAHVYCLLTHTAMESGFAAPYHFAVQFASLFYFLAGLFFLVKLLSLYFSDRIVALTLFCLVFGTNILYYLTIGSGMSHTTTFCFMTMFLYYTVRWHQNPGPRNALITGVLGGLLTLIRPINILAYVFFFLYNIASISDLRKKLRLLTSNISSIVIMALCGILCFVPQLLYWKHISGAYFFNSYVNEHFYFLHPHILDSLFSFRKGWLLYTPLMALALTGIYFLRTRLKSFYYATLIFTALYVYVVSSWWCWWYGGSFGQRPMIDIYPLLAIPFAVFLTVVSEKSAAKKRTVYLLISLLIALNLFQSIQAKYNIIHYDSMTKENYFRVFFTITKQADRELYLKHPDNARAMKGEDE